METKKVQESTTHQILVKEGMGKYTNIQKYIDKESDSSLIAEIYDELWIAIICNRSCIQG